MTVSTTDSQIDYSSGGPSFPIPFKFLRDEDIQPVLTLADGSQVVLTQNVQYTLTGSGNEGGGTLTSAYAQTAINSGALLRIARIMQPTQETDLRNQGRYFAETHERVFDRLTMLIQQALTGVANSLSLNSLKNRWDFKGLRGVNVGDPIDPKDVANKGYVDTSNAAQDTRIDALSAGLPGTNYAFPWSTTTTTGTKTLTPGFEFASATLYINGIAQTYGKSFAVAGNKILLAQAVPAGTEIYAILGQFVLPNAKDRSRVISVFDFGAKGDGVTDDSPAFQEALNSLPANGGTIQVPDASYYLSTNVNYGNKSVYWMFGAAASFSGAGIGEGKFPYMVTNPAQLAVGPYIRSYSSERSTNSNGGIAALNAEMIQPADYVGQSVAAYFGAVGSNPTAGANVWALNTLVRAEAGAKGTYQCIEIDVDNFSTDALVKGISISGAGTVGPRVAVEIVRANNTPWAYGIDALNCVTGMRIRASTQTKIGVLVGAPATQLNAVLSAKMLANGDDGVLLERTTDTSPTGNYLRGVNAANSQNVFTLGITGNFATIGNLSTSAGYVRGPVLDATGPVSASPAGGVRISASTATTVGAAGTAAALPSAPQKYLVINQDGVNYKIPLFLA